MDCLRGHSHILGSVATLLGILAVLWRFRHKKISHRHTAFMWATNIQFSPFLFSIISVSPSATYFPFSHFSPFPVFPVFPPFLPFPPFPPTNTSQPSYLVTQKEFQHLLRLRYLAFTMGNWLPANQVRMNWRLHFKIHRFWMLKILSSATSILLRRGIFGVGKLARPNEHNIAKLGWHGFFPATQ